MNRETIVIPEQKEKIEKIKRKYNKMNMRDDIASRVSRLEVTNNILKFAAIGAGVITALDIFVPDPILGLDEAALIGITTLLSSSSSLIENKIDSLVNTDGVDIKMDEITHISKQIENAANAIKTSRSNIQK